MLGADRRGILAGGEQASKWPKRLPVEEIQSIAHQVLTHMRDAGYAHLDPEKDFVRGFVESFQYANAPSHEAKNND